MGFIGVMIRQLSSLFSQTSQASAMIERPTLPDNSVACSVELREDAAKRLYSPSRLM